MKQKRCAYCMDFMPLSVEPVPYGRKEPGVALDPGIGYGWDLVVRTDAPDPIRYRVNYCPMCGSNLMRAHHMVGTR